VILQVIPLRFEFQALDPIAFPAGTAANTFRGAFGEIFRSQSDPGTYSRIFRPRADTGTPSGLKDLPRPFVLRAASLDGRSFEPGQRFTLDINIFDPEIPALDYFRQSFIRLAAEGLGPARPRIELIDAVQLPVIEHPLTPTDQSITKIQVEFLTPTELKSGGETLHEPRFDALLKRARDRVAGLIAIYQKSESETDFTGMGKRAESIRMTASHIEQLNYERHSTRTGQCHSLGGFIGTAEFEGNLTEFFPWLQAAWWTGVGRLTVWGNGMIRTVRA
jgi:hypothetical protein